MDPERTRHDRVDGRRVAALVFRHGPHTINLFIWPGDGSAAPAMEQKLADKPYPMQSSSAWQERLR